MVRGRELVGGPKDGELIALPDHQYEMMLHARFWFEHDQTWRYFTGSYKDDEGGKTMSWQGWEPVNVK